MPGSLKTYSQLTALLLLFIFIGISCKDTLSGDFNENKPPSTFLTVDKINREGDFRLSSQIKISWWGNDPDGYIVGYEYAINDTSEGAWSFTTKTDSTFILPISQGEATDNVLFKIRAVDNDDAKDPQGARLIYPIINSNPEVSIIGTETPPDTLYNVASFGWSINDPDGLPNVARTEIALNDTTGEWTTIPLADSDDQVFISLAFDNTTIGTTDASLFIGESYSTVPDVRVPNIKVGEDNTFYVRVIDNAGAQSPIARVNWFVKPRLSNTLIINDNAVGDQQFHYDKLISSGITPDVWILDDDPNQDPADLSEYLPAVYNPTLRKTLSSWDHIYWVSSNINRNLKYVIEVIDEFFDGGGSMFVAIPMQSGLLPGDDLLNFISVDSVASGSFLILNNELVTSPNEVVDDTLKVISQGGFALSNVFPFKASSGATELYETLYYRRTNTSIREFTQYNSVALENAEGNLIYFGLDMPSLNGNNNLDEMMNELLINRLNFKQ